jgi:hypothetical protein
MVGAADQIYLEMRFSSKKAKTKQKRRQALKRKRSQESEGIEDEKTEHRKGAGCSGGASTHTAAHGAVEACQRGAS